MVIMMSALMNGGKDTVASYLVRKYGFTRFAFADKIRESLYALNPLIPVGGGNVMRLQKLVDAQGWDAVKRSYCEVRELMQRLGTEAGRDVLGNHVWTSALLSEQPTGDFPKECKVVISDLRFADEHEAIYWETEGGIKGKAVFVFHITDPRMVNVDGHISEAMDVFSLPKCNLFVIENTGTLAELHDKVDMAYIDCITMEATRTCDKYEVKRY
jgi:hypothetical protein